MNEKWVFKKMTTFLVVFSLALKVLKFSSVVSAAEMRMFENKEFVRAWADNGYLI